MGSVPTKVPSVCEWVGLIEGAPLQESPKRRFVKRGILANLSFESFECFFFFPQNGIPAKNNKIVENSYFLYCLTVYSRKVLVTTQNIGVFLR